MRWRRRFRRSRRLVTLVVLVGGGIAVRRAAAARRTSTPHVAPPSAWPPLEVGEAPVAAVGDLVTAADAGRTWVTPVDGGCPATHPVKANTNSGIYHVPGGRFYERTRAERCYVDAAAAEADGYRAAKGS